LPRLPGQNGFNIRVIHPGTNSWIGLGSLPDYLFSAAYTESASSEASAKGGTIDLLRLTVPLERGCAMVELSYAWIRPMGGTFWFDSPTYVEMGSTIVRSEVRYTTDGTEPTSASPGGWETHVPIQKTATFRAAVFAGGQRVGDVMTAEFVRLPPIAAAKARG
jgi:hypothetical protein